MTVKHSTEIAELRGALFRLADHCTVARSWNSHEWMELHAKLANDAVALLGEPMRIRYVPETGKMDRSRKEPGS